MRLSELPPRYQTQVRNKLNPSVPRLVAGLRHQKTASCEKGSKTPVGAFCATDGKSYGKTARSASGGGNRTKSAMSFEIKSVAYHWDMYRKIHDFLLLVDPATMPTAQQKGVGIRGGHVHFFTKKKVLAWESALTSALRPFAGKLSELRQRADDEGVALNVTFGFRFPKNATEQQRRQNVVAMVKRPDLDNLFKGVGDSIVKAGLLDDDNAISNLQLVKVRTTGEPFIRIMLNSDGIFAC